MPGRRLCRGSSLHGWRQPWRVAAMVDGGHVGWRPHRAEAVVDAGCVGRRPLQAVAVAGGGHYVAVQGESGGCGRRRSRRPADMTGGTVINERPYPVPSRTVQRQPLRPILHTVRDHACSSCSPTVSSVSDPWLQCWPLLPRHKAGLLTLMAASSVGASHIMVQATNTLYGK